MADKPDKPEMKASRMMFDMVGVAYEWPTNPICPLPTGWRGGECWRQFRSATAEVRLSLQPGGSAAILRKD